MCSAIHSPWWGDGSGFLPNLYRETIPNSHKKITRIMNADLQRRVQRYGWDRAVPFYERGWKDQLFPAQSLMLLMADLQAGERVLETACGTGLVSLRAALAVGPSGTVVGTDISDGMIRRAQQQAEAWALPQLTFLRQDAEALRVPAGYFDAALCALGMMYFPNPLTALQQMRQRLRGGGRIAAAVWGRREACGWHPIFPIVDARVRTDVCPLFFQLGEGDNLSRTFQAAGLESVRCRRIQTTLHYADAEKALHAVFSGGPVAMAYARFDPGTRKAVHEEYLRAIEPYRKGNGYAIPGEFVVSVGSQH